MYELGNFPSRVRSSELLGCIWCLTSDQCPVDLAQLLKPRNSWRKRDRLATRSRNTTQLHSRQTSIQSTAAALSWGEPKPGK